MTGSTGIVVADRDRDVILVEGADSGTFLHSQLAADILVVPVGAGAHSLLLEPTGHVAALVRVVRRDETVWTMDVESGHGAAVIERLARFVLRAKVTMTPVEWLVRGWRGSGARAAVGAVAGCADPGWGSPDEIDVVAAAEDLARIAIDATPTEPAHLDVLRVDARWPAFGVDLLAGDVPATSGILGAAVSFTKGCYPGQELVERMDSRGSQAPVHLRVFPRDGLAVGSRIVDDGRDVGTVTSVGAALAIARVARGTGVGQPIAPDTNRP